MYLNRPFSTIVSFSTPKGVLQRISHYKWCMTLAHWQDPSLPLVRYLFYTWVVWGKACQETSPKAWHWLDIVASTARIQQVILTSKPLDHDATIIKNNPNYNTLWDLIDIYLYIYIYIYIYIYSIQKYFPQNSLLGNKSSRINFLSTCLYVTKTCPQAR